MDVSKSNEKVKTTRKVFSGKDYIETLKPHVKKRYIQKIESFCDGKDPYDLIDKELKLVHDNQGLGEGSEIIPPILFPDLYMYLVKSKSAYTNDELKNYKSLEAYNQFISGFVREVRAMTFEKSGNVVIKSLVMHSQRLNEKALHVWIVASPSGTILACHCDCMAGLNECCTHIGALLFYVECGVRYRESVTVTGVKAYWAVPVIKKVSYAPVHKLNLKSAKVRKDQFDALIEDGNPPPLPKTDIKKQKDVPDASKDDFNKLTQTLFNLNPNAGLFRVLPLFQNQFIPKKINYPPMLTDLYNNQNLAFNELLDYCDKEVDISFTEKEAKKLEADTKTQAKNEVWQKYRAGRITASNFRKACHSNPTQPSPSLISQICYPASHKFETLATKWGIKYESTMIKIYCNLSSKKHKKFTFEKAGLFLHVSYPHLGASPDGLVDCECCGKGLIEVKCPYNLREMTSHTVNGGTCLERTETGVQLKRQHSYYYQVQAQIFLTDRKYCDFCIWTPVDFYIERILPDESFWKEKSSQALKFFKLAILPELCGKYYSSSNNSNVVNVNSISSQAETSDHAVTMTGPTITISQAVTTANTITLSHAVPMKTHPTSHAVTTTGHPITSSPTVDTTSHPQTTTSNTQSCTSNTQSCTSNTQSCTSNTQSCTSNTQSCTSNTQSCTSNTQSCTSNTQSFTSNTQSFTSNTQSCTSRPQSCTSHPQSCTSRPQSSTSRPQSSTSRPQSSTSRPQSSTSRPQITTSRPQITTSPAITTTSPYFTTSSLAGTTNNHGSTSSCKLDHSKKPPSRTPMAVLSPNKKKIKTSPKCWCYCREPESGLMIGCDRDDCSIQWFHAECLKIDFIKSGKWFCPDCAKINKQERSKKRAARKCF